MKPISVASCHARIGQPYLWVPGQDDADDHQQYADREEWLQNRCQKLCGVCVYVSKVSQHLQGQPPWVCMVHCKPRREITSSMASTAKTWRLIHLIAALLV